MDTFLLLSRYVIQLRYSSHESYISTGLYLGTKAFIMHQPTR